jgi:hypothetical protein
MNSKITSEAKFFASSIGISEMVNNYSFNELMAFFTYGKNMKKYLDYIVDNNLCSKFEVNPIVVVSDAIVIEMKLTLVEVAMERKSNCQIMVSNALGGSIHILHNN